MNNFSRRFEESLDRFVGDLSVLVRAEAVKAAEQVLFGSKPRAIVPSKSRVRRSSQDLMQLADALCAFYAENPGSGIAAASKALDIPIKALARPTQLLLSESRLRKEGQRRQMTYFAVPKSESQAA